MNTWRRKGRIGAGLNRAALTQQRNWPQFSCSCRRCTLKPAVGNTGAECEEDGEATAGAEESRGARGKTESEPHHTCKIHGYCQRHTSSLDLSTALLHVFVDLTTDSSHVRLLHVFLDLRSGLNPDWVTCRKPYF